MTQTENFTIMTLDTKISHYLPFPAFLLDLKLSNTARILYALLLNRIMLSQKNRLTDESGRVYAVYPVMSFAGNIHRSRKTVMMGLSELEQAGLLIKQHNDTGRPNLLMIRVPDSWNRKQCSGGEEFSPPPVQFLAESRYQKLPRELLGN